MKPFLLITLLAALPASAQEYSIPVRHEAGPARSYGTPLFYRTDSTVSPARMLSGSQRCYVTSKIGPWYRVQIEDGPSYYAVASSIAIPGYPGHETLTPCPDANAVVAYLDEAPADAWRKACQALLSSSYTIAQRDADLYTFATTPKALGRTSQLTLTGFVQPGPGGKGAAITISGSYTYLAVGLGPLYTVNTTTIARPAIFTGGPNNSDRIAFSALDEVAHAIPMAKVKYALR